MEFSVPIAGKTAGKLQVIITNLHWRYSGVTATNRMVAPKLDAMIEAAWLGTDAPDGIRRMGSTTVPFSNTLSGGATATATL